MTFYFCLNEKLFLYIFFQTFDPKLVNKVRPRPIRPISTETVRIFQNTHKNVSKRVFAITFKQDCETFASFFDNFSPEKCTRRILLQKENTTPVTTVPDLPGLLDRCAF